MKKIPVILLLAILCLQACRKNPYFPHHRCPQPQNCQLAMMYTSKGQATHNSGEPANPAIIVRDASGKPIKYKGYPTDFSKLTTNNISYSGNRMIFTDSALGIKRLEVWLNECGQPDSTSWYDLEHEYQYPANIKYYYNSAKQLTRFVAHIQTAYGLWPFEAHIQRDSHGNVTAINDGAHRIEYTYDYTAPRPNLQWYTISSAYPEWGALYVLDQLGMIGFKTSHLPYRMENWQGDYQMESIFFTNWVLDGNKATSYEVRRYDPGSSDHNTHLFTLTSAWTCGGSPGKK